MRSIDIGQDLTEEGLAKLKVGQIMRFDYEGSITELKITKINRKSHKCYVREVRTYTPDEWEQLMEGKQ